MKVEGMTKRRVTVEALAAAAGVFVIPVELFRARNGRHWIRYGD